MVNVQFYNNKSDSEVVNKSKTAIGTAIACQIYDDCDVANPTLLVGYSDALTHANYCYIDKFSSYYFCDAPIIYDGQKLRIDCHRDALVTFWDDIKKSDCIASRSTSKVNPEIVDDNVLSGSNKTIRFVPLDMKSFSPSNIRHNYVLTVAGGQTQYSSNNSN